MRYRPLVSHAVLHRIPTEDRKPRLDELDVVGRLVSYHTIPFAIFVSSGNEIHKPLRALRFHPVYRWQTPFPV